MAVLAGLVVALLFLIDCRSPHTTIHASPHASVSDATVEAGQRMHLAPSFPCNVTTATVTFDTVNGSATAAASATPVGQVAVGDGVQFASQAGVTYIVKTVSSAHIILTLPYTGLGAAADTLTDYVGLLADPNNCGACGTLCGTYGPNPNGPLLPGASFQQGTCSNAVCSPYAATTASLDCWDIPTGNVVGGTAGFVPICASVLSGSQNCGGLGWMCNGTCLQGRCNGALKIPPPLVITGLSTTAVAITLTATGGVPGYQFSYTPQGNQSGGTMAAGGLYTPGLTEPVTDIVMVTDSVGNVAVFSISVT